jgi:aerobic carbon-monoxide dehydrogenase medium subunit
MKPPPFAYVAPTALPAAVETLAEHGDDAKVLAGGQSLVPALNFRLARPEIVVDINRLHSLNTLTVEDSALRIGALARHEDVLTAAARGVLGPPGSVDPLGALLERIGRYVGHLPIRVRGTFAGSLAHADPAAEWCALAVALDAQVHAASVRGERVVAAADLFDGPYMTTLAPDELVTEVRLPLLGPSAGVGFAELARTAGDFALVAAVAAAELDGQGPDATIRSARIGLAGVGPSAVRARAAEEVLTGQAAGPEVLEEAAAAAADGVDPSGDLHASTGYRRHLVRVLTRRALADAVGAQPQQGAA